MADRIQLWAGTDTPRGKTNDDDTDFYNNMNKNIRHENDLNIHVVHLHVLSGEYLPSVLSRVSQNWLRCCCLCSSARSRASKPGFW